MPAQVLHKSDKAEEASAQIAAYIKAHYPGGESGIAYVLTRCGAAAAPSARRCLRAGLLPRAAFMICFPLPAVRQGAPPLLHCQRPTLLPRLHIPKP